MSEATPLAIGPSFPARAWACKDFPVAIVMQNGHASAGQSGVLERFPLGQLWQVPAFLVGVAALAGLLLSRPLWRDPEERRLERQLHELRQGLARPEIDSQRALALEEEVGGRAEVFPAKAGTAHFLLGSLYLRLGEGGTGPEAPARLAAARRHLERADGLGVSEEDNPSLRYRLARSWHLTQDNPQGIIDVLTAILDERFTEAAQGYDMLARAYLRLSPPNPEQALEANKKLLALPTADEELLIPARLLQGELLSNLKRPAEARSVLIRIGAAAAAPVRARARELRAQLSQQLEDWGEAVQLWEAALADDACPPADPARVRFDLGRCYRALGNLAKAEDAWKAVLSSSGDQAQAAAFELAELAWCRDVDAAVDYFERAVREVNGPSTYRNSILDLAAARERLRNGAGRLCAQGDFPRALKMTRLYQRVADTPEVLKLRGQTEEAWGTALREARDPGAAVHFSEAGDAYARVATATPEERPAWRRRAADMYREAGADAKAIEQLRLFVAEEPAPEACGGGHLGIAQAFERLNNRMEAEKAYLKCIQFPGAAAWRARFRLAELKIADGNLGDAETDLGHCLDLMNETDSLYPRVLFTLADVHFKNQHFQKARDRYTEALARSTPTPALSPYRLRLAEACWQEALGVKSLRKIEPTLNIVSRIAMEEHRKDQCQRSMREAINHYEQLCADLVQRRTQAPLAAEEEAILRRADLALAACLYELGDLPTALRQYELLASRYQSQVEQLFALRGLYLCHMRPGEFYSNETARAKLQEMADLLGRFDDRAFPPVPGAWSRRDWSNWIQQQMNELAKNGR